MIHPDDVEQDLYNTIYDQIKDEIREDLLNELDLNIVNNSIINHDKPLNLLDNNINIDNNNNKKSKPNIITMEEVNKKLENDKQNEIISEINENKESNINNIIDEDIPFPKCPIITINNEEDFKTEWKYHVSSEIFRIVEDNKILNDKISKDEKVDKKTLNEAIDYIIVKRKMKNIPSNRNHITNSIKRSCKLFNKHGEVLKK
jgi:hypothetical protein